MAGNETTCYVKQDQPVRGRFVFEPLFGSGVRVVSPTPPVARGDFLRLFVVPGHDYPGRAHICIEATAVSSSVKYGKKGLLLLRNVRIELPKLGAVHLVRCAACGLTEFALPDDLVGECWTRCRLCKAAPASMVCGVWHSYGVCEHCSDERVEGCPFELTGSLEERAVADHVG